MPDTGQQSQSSSPIALGASTVRTEQQDDMHLQSKAGELDMLQKRVLQQLEVEKEMRSCVEAVLSKERAHSRKLQHLLSDSQREVARLSSRRCLTPMHASAISSAIEEGSNAAMAVRKVKSTSERAVLESSAAWDAESSQLKRDISILRVSWLLSSVQCYANGFSNKPYLKAHCAESIELNKS
eukprot:jgi/Ulvmu1/7228/UM035_0015.1